MRKNALKMLAISALRAHPDFSQLGLLKYCSRRQIEAFLRWLDHSGLALYFFAQLRYAGELRNVPLDIQEALSRRFRSNRIRMEDMLAEFAKVNSELTHRGIPHAFLKGFTLIPAFCPDPVLRHQSDIDILVSLESVPQAIHLLTACGYARKSSNASGEIRFATPLRHVPSLHDDLYGKPLHWEVELHTSIWEETGHASISVPHDCLERASNRALRGIHFTSLSTKDMFLMQVLHAFSHLLGSWVRVSWLWEMHYFLQKHAKEEELWLAIKARAGDAVILRKALGLTLGLTTKLFETPIPEVLKDWCIETLPDRVHTWIRHFGAQWALSELNGSKLTLFIHQEFLSGAKNWQAYFLRRLIPLPGRPSLGPIEASDVKTQLKGSAAQVMFTCRRMAFHAGAILTLAWDAFRWRHALQSSRRQRVVRI